MTEAREHLWRPIEDLPPDWESLKDTELHSLRTAWQEQAESMRQGKAYNDFLIRLRREWAIETGQIERLYSISEGATKTLIEQGFDASLLSHEDTDQHPEKVIDYIKDQYRAIEGLYQFIGGERPLGTSYIKELHCVLTAHQTHCHARDTLGYAVLRELPHGTWKMAPNNVELGDEKIFEFCPYEQVDSEMDQLIAWHEEHEGKNVPPEIESAWLHHRFTLIHPFIDGNGRVARCLATLVLLKHHWFPLVVTRGDRAEYLSALRDADRGDLEPLAMLFGLLQKRAIKYGMSLSEEVERGAAAIQEILGRVKEKVEHDRAAKQLTQQKVYEYGASLLNLARTRLREIGGQVESFLRDSGIPNYRVEIAYAGPSGSHSAQFGYQIAKCAESLGYFANLTEYRAWCRLAILSETPVEILFAFHGIGREFSGALVCSGMAYTNLTTGQGHEVSDLVSLSREPFYFAYSEPLSQIHERFNKWIDSALVEGLDYWRKAIGA
jgi:Fic family protein